MRYFLKTSVALSATSLLFGGQLPLLPLPAQAQVPLGPSGCPPGTSDRFSRNLVRNGTFAEGRQDFTTSPELNFQGINGYGEGFSVVNNTATFRNNIDNAGVGGVLDPQPFPGDPTRGIDASQSYYYSNPSNLSYANNQGAPTLWQQDNIQVQPNTAYNFLIYLNNVLRVGPGDPQSGNNRDFNGYPPVIELRVSSGGNSIPVRLVQPTTVRTVPDQWVPIQVAFVTGPTQTTASLSIVDAAGREFGIDPNTGNFAAIVGDDFSFTALGLRRCLPNIGVAKQAGTPVRNSNGTYTVPYTIRVRNLASVAGAQYALNDLSLQENLATTFTGATVNGVNNLQSPTLRLNPNFNGTTDTELLQTPSTLQPGETATVSFNVVVTPGTGPNGFGPFNNRVRAIARAQDGTPVQDDSTDGVNSDPNNDGNPSENTPTVVTLPQSPQIGLAKQAGTPTNNGDGSFTIPYTFTVRNTGATVLNNVQITENLSQTFGQATSFSVVPSSISGTGVTVNQAFNGTSVTNLLAPGNTLGLNQAATVTFSVRLVPGSNLGPYNNTATASSTSPNGTQVTDDSQDGTEPDPDSNGNPGDNSTPTTINLGSIGNPSLRLVKRVTRVVQATGGAEVNFSSFIDGPGTDDNAPGLVQFQPQRAAIGVINIDNPPLQSGDEMEYTIYFLSDGTTPALNVNLCDPIPLGTRFIPNSNQVQRNNGSIALGGTFFSPLAPLPADNACPDQTNPNGAVIFNLGTISNLPGSNFGFVRFRVRID